MSLLEQFFSESHLRAIAAMLFHSIWQGTLLAVTTAIVLLVTKKSSPAFRYNVLVTLFFVFAAGTVYTYFSHLSPNSAEFSASSSITEQIKNNEYNAPVFSETTIASFSSLLHTHASLIVFCWLILLLIRLCYIVTGYYSANRLTRTKLISPPEYWNERWMVLNERMKISQPVLLMQSSLAKVPMVIGHLKPVVLVPVGMLLSLNPTEVEAVLLHELAHVKRRDYLLNLVQQAIQCVFFFHPAVLWVCSLISAEREHCCDEMAASQNGDKRIYINALVSFYERTLPSAVALSFGGRNQRSIVDRVRRLIHQRNKTLNYMEKIFLTAALVLTAFFVYAFYHNGTNTGPGILRAATTDSIPRGKVTMNWTENGKSYNAVFNNDQISELTVDGKKIPPERYKDYQPVIDRMRENQEEAERDAEQAREDAEEAIEHAKEAHDEAVRESDRAKKQMERGRQDGERGNDDDGSHMNEERVDEIVANALNEVEKVLDELRVELKDGKLRDEVRSAIEDAQQGLKEARIELREGQKSKGRHEDSSFDFEDDEKIEKITEEAVHLALEAAHLGLREANLELKELAEQDRSEQMDRKEYRERKKQLREQYRNGQR